MKAVALGAHILDVLVRYVTEIPEGQGGTLVDEIRLSPAGAAGGVAVTLARLGAEVHSAGAVGKDNLGDVLLSELERFGVDCPHLVRREGVQTSTSVLPIRPTGERPALHVIGANGSCGDAYTAGFLRGLSLDRTPEEAARLGFACASLVAQGLGTDAGDFDTNAVLARAEA